MANARPIGIEFKDGVVSNKMVVFSAASGNEISSSIKQKLHGLFTYYFLKGLNGDSDKNKDNKITVTEMHDYLSENVSVQSQKMGREQHPRLLGINKD